MQICGSLPYWIAAKSVEVSWAFWNNHLYPYMDCPLLRTDTAVNRFVQLYRPDNRSLMNGQTNGLREMASRKENIYNIKKVWTLNFAQIMYLHVYVLPMFLKIMLASPNSINQSSFHNWGAVYFLRVAENCLKPRMAAGPDSIHNVILKTSASDCSQIYCKILSRVWVILDCWLDLLTTYSHNS